MSSSTKLSEPSYVSGPNGRGTVELLWSCSVTFGLCIWTVVHPNIIPWHTFRDQMFYKLSWMILAVLFPEIFVGIALRQLLEAREILICWKQHIEPPEAKEWLGLPGAFFAAMGGFVIVPPRTTQSPLNQEADTSTKFVTTLRTSGFCKLLESGLLNDLIKRRTLTEASFLRRNITDKGKADSVAKFLLCLQITWMCIQCLGRVLSGLPITLLEGHVLIQIFFAVCAHVCWWYKPLDVSEPFPLPLEDILEESPDYIRVGPGREDIHTQCDLLTAEVSVGGFFRMLFHAAYDILSHHSHKAEFLAALLGMLNGGLHLVAWNYHFPSDTERLLWRISCLSAGGLPPIVFLLVGRLSVEELVVRATLNAFLPAGDISNWRILWNELSTLVTDAAGDGTSWPAFVPRRARLHIGILTIVATAWYILCMLYLTIEPFLSVRSLPKGAYTTVEWTDFLPHY